MALAQISRRLSSKPRHAGGPGKMDRVPGGSRLVVELDDHQSFGNFSLAVRTCKRTLCRPAIRPKRCARNSAPPSLPSSDLGWADLARVGALCRGRRAFGHKSHPGLQIFHSTAGPLGCRTSLKCAPVPLQSSGLIPLECCMGTGQTCEQQQLNRSLIQPRRYCFTFAKLLSAPAPDAIEYCLLVSGAGIKVRRWR